MIAPPERSAERDAAIDSLLPHIQFDGWTHIALARALAASGQHPDDAMLLFPGGAADMVEAFCDLADRRMAADAAALDLSSMRLPARVRAVIALRLARNRPHKEAIRRALGVLALPMNARIAAACTARTVDAIWHVVGDTAADFSWYTKRASLAAVYAATLLFWLHDTSADNVATLEFLDRRLAGIARIGTLRRRVEEIFAGFIPPRFSRVPPGAP